MLTAYNIYDNLTMNITFIGNFSLKLCAIIVTDSYSCFLLRMRGPSAFAHNISGVCKLNIIPLENKPSRFFTNLHFPHIEFLKINISQHFIPIYRNISGNNMSIMLSKFVSFTVKSPSFVIHIKLRYVFYILNKNMRCG